MEILLWLVPAACASVVAMAWVAWWGRETRTSIDRDEAARRLGEALARSQVDAPRYAAPRRRGEGAGGVAVRRPSEPSRPAEQEVAIEVEAVPTAPAEQIEQPGQPAVEEHRHAS